MKKTPTNKCWRNNYNEVKWYIECVCLGGWEHQIGESENVLCEEIRVESHLVLKDKHLMCRMQGGTFQAANSWYKGLLPGDMGSMCPKTEQRPMRLERTEWDEGGKAEDEERRWRREGVKKASVDQTGDSSWYKCDGNI